MFFSHLNQVASSLMEASARLNPARVGELFGPQAIKARF